MSTHPENSPEVNAIIEEIQKSDTCDIWCLGCGAWRKMNAGYAKHLKGEIYSCAQCSK